MSEHKTLSLRKVSKGMFAAIIAVSLMLPSLAFAEPTAADKQAEAASVLASLNEQQAVLSKASDDHFAALEELNQAQASMNKAQKRIDEATERIGVLQDKLGTRVNSMYRNGNMSFFDLIVGSTSFEEFATNWDILSKMNQNDADLVQETKDLRAEVEEQKVELARQEAIAAEKTAEAEKIKSEAEATTAAMQATYDSLSAEAEALLEQERAAQEAAEAAAAAQVVEQASQGATNNGGGGGGGGGQDSGGFTPNYDVVTGNAIVDRAYGCLGAPYVWGACGPNGFDCSGLVSYAVSGSYTRLGTTHTFMGWPRVSDPQPGDIAVNSGHTGIYIGGGQMIHASTYGVGVIVGPVQGGMIFVRP